MLAYHPRGPEYHGARDPLPGLGKCEQLSEVNPKDTDAKSAI